METEYDSIYGTIVVKWKLCGETVTLCVRVPENTCATLELANVKKMLETDGAAFTRTQDVMTAELGSGEYQFVYEPEIGKE